MRIGVVKEIKPAELRVALTPAGTEELVDERPHGARRTRCRGRVGVPRQCLCQRRCRHHRRGGQGLGGRGRPGEGERAGRARTGAAARRARAFTYLHLAAAPELTRALVMSGTTGVGYETVEGASGHLPCWRP